MPKSWKAVIPPVVAIIVVLSTAGAQISSMFSDQLIHDEYIVEETTSSSGPMDGININQVIWHIDGFVISSTDGDLYSVDQNLELTSILPNFSVKGICSSGEDLFVNLGTSIAKVTDSDVDIIYTLSDSDDGIYDFDCNDEYISLISLNDVLVTLSSPDFALLNTKSVEGDAIQVFTNSESNSVIEISAKKTKGVLNFFSQNYDREVFRPDAVILDYEYDEITKSLVILYSDGTLFENKMESPSPPQRSSSMGSSTNTYFGFTTILPDKGLVVGCTSQLSAGYQPMPLPGSAIFFYDIVENSIETLDIDGISGMIRHCVADSDESSILVVSDTGSMVKISIEISADESDGGINLTFAVISIIGVLAILIIVAAAVINLNKKSDSKHRDKQADTITESKVAPMAPNTTNEE